jgi:hypothetical protein
MNTQTIGDADWLKGTIRYNTKQQQYNYKVRWKNTKPSYWSIFLKEGPSLK